MISRTLLLHLRANALDPFTWPRYVAGSTWQRPIDMLTWSQSLLREVAGPLQAHTSDPVDVATGMLMVAYEELHAVSEGRVVNRRVDGRPADPAPSPRVPPPTAEVARAILRAAMVACEARPRWAKAIVTGRRTMLDLLGVLACRIETSPYVQDVGDAWTTYHTNTSVSDYYNPSPYEEASLAMFEAGTVVETSWRGVSRFEFPEVERNSRRTTMRRWVYGDAFTFPVEETIARVETLPHHLGRSVLARLRERGLTQQEWNDSWSAPTEIQGLRRAVADAGGYSNRRRSRAGTRVIRAFNAFLETWFRHAEEERVRRFQVISWPNDRLVLGPQAVTREGLVANPVQALATIRSVRDDVAGRVQARRDGAAEVAAAYQEWIDAHQAYLVASGQVVPTAIRDAA